MTGCGLPELSHTRGVYVYCLRFVYCEETKREVKRILMYECRSNEKQKGKTEGSTRLVTTLVYTGFHGGLEHLKIETSCS